MASTTIFNASSTSISNPVPTTGISTLGCEAVVRGSGAVSATVAWEVNVDGTSDEWVYLGQTFCNGTDVATDGFSAPLKPWAWIRCRLTAISGTGAYVVCKIGW